uniref:Lipoprotein n=1 Tax=Pyxidicoccus fallax TaxID=394095 RepID=A0A3S5GXX0_9BACT|nr:lipoprotein [Pyxidicoccus fallax]
MREVGSRRWSQAVVAVAVLLGTGCGGMPVTGGKSPEPRGNVFAQRGDQAPALMNMEGGQTKEQLPAWTYPAGRGYNGTIRQIGSSIDPRTPQTDGQQGQSKWDDPSGMMQDRYSTLGGATYSPAAQGLGGEDGAEQGNGTYHNRGAGFSPLDWQNRNDRNVR